MISLAEENYLKTIYVLQESDNAAVSTSALAKALQISAASVTDFIQKIAVKKLINYKKSKGVTLSRKGKEKAIAIIRKHRLWEVWLVEKLGLKWDEIHEIAEQLEHVDSSLLIERLDSYLGYPKVDPHGDQIPDAKGRLSKTIGKLLLYFPKGSTIKFIGVVDHSPAFLQYLTKINLDLGDVIKIEAIEAFDYSFHVKINGSIKKILSKEVAKNLLVV